MRRVVFVWLPYWTSERSRRDGAPEGPVVFVETRESAVRIAALNPAARGLGLVPGQPLADARALAPKLACRPHAPAADARALARLARWLGRYGARAAPVRSGPPEEAGVFVDVTGAAHLFGGDEALLADLLARLKGFGLTARAAMADTPGAAWGLARHHPRGGAGCVAPMGAGLAALSALPVAALGLAPATLEGLRALGLSRVEAVSALPRASLARRFGQALPDRLDAIDGRIGDPLDPLEAPQPFRAFARLAEPIVTREALEAVAARLAPRLCRDLALRGHGLRKAAFRLYRVDGAALDVTLGAGRPLADPARLLRLLKDRLDAVAERLDLGFGVDACALLVTAAAPLRAQAQALDLDAAAAHAGEAGLADLADRLAARLGEEALARAAPRGSWLPERAVVRSAKPARFPPGRLRPPLLFARPEPAEALAEIPDGPPRRFRWRRVAHDVARAEGPERIAAEWWRAEAPTRDYYRVETKEGRRFWLYREGLFGAETDAPKWFVHGVFG